MLYILKVYCEMGRRSREGEKNSGFDKKFHGSRAQKARPTGLHPTAAGSCVFGFAAYGYRYTAQAWG